MDQELFNPEFLMRRKNEFEKIYIKMKNANLDCTFRGVPYKELMTVLLTKAFRIVSISDAFRAKSTGNIRIKSKKDKKEIGVLYLREYNDKEESLQTNNYDIEVMIKKDNLKEGMYFVHAINEVFGEPDLLLKPSCMTNMALFVWGCGSCYYQDLEHRLKEEFGEDTKIKYLEPSDKKETPPIEKTK